MRLLIVLLCILFYSCEQKPISLEEATEKIAKITKRKVIKKSQLIITRYNISNYTLQNKANEKLRTLLEDNNGKFDVIIDGTQNKNAGNGMQSNYLFILDCEYNPLQNILTFKLIRKNIAKNAEKVVAKKEYLITPQALNLQSQYPQFVPLHSSSPKKPNNQEAEELDVILSEIVKPVKKKLPRDAQLILTYFNVPDDSLHNDSLENLQKDIRWYLEKTFTEIDKFKIVVCNKCENQQEWNFGDVKGKNVYILRGEIVNIDGISVLKYKLVMRGFRGKETVMIADEFIFNISKINNH